MEGGKLKLCKSELPALQPSPSASASSLALRLHKGDSQQSCTESSILNTGEQRQTHAKKETTTKKKKAAKSACSEPIMAKELIQKVGRTEGLSSLLCPKFLRLPRPRTGCPGVSHSHSASSAWELRKRGHKEKNTPEGGGGGRSLTPDR